MEVHSSHKMPNPLWKNPDDPNRFINEYPACKRCKTSLLLKQPCSKASKRDQRNGSLLDLN